MITMIKNIIVETDKRNHLIDFMNDEVMISLHKKDLINLIIWIEYISKLKVTFQIYQEMNLTNSYYGEKINDNFDISKTNIKISAIANNGNLCIRFYVPEKSKIMIIYDEIIFAKHRIKKLITNLIKLNQQI